VVSCRRTTLGLLACLAVTAVAACRGADVPKRGPAIPAAELADRGRRATGIVVSGTCRGSGFFIAPTLLLTNAHVLCAEAAEIHLGSVTVPARFEKIDDELDVALLRTDEAPASVTPLPLADALELREGDMLTAIGAPADAGELVTAVSGPVTRPLTALWGVLHVEADLPVSPGNSGGPLVDDRGRVVAVVSKRRVLRGQGWALGIPIDYVVDWLPAGLAARNPEWHARVAEAADEVAPDLERFRDALARPILLGAHYLPMSAGPGTPERDVLVFVVAAPADAPSRGLASLTVRLTCGDTRAVTTRLSPWVAVDQPLERSMRIDVTPLRPFLAWARQQGVAGGVVLATGDAVALGAPVDCPGRRLAIADAGTDTGIVIE
jgi:S1-C subfamily serine protease